MKSHTLLFSVILVFSFTLSSTLAASEKRSEIRKWSKRVSGEDQVSMAGAGFMSYPTVEKKKPDNKKSDEKADQKAPEKQDQDKDKK